jgi:starvation-inducible DNA-binding protein
MLSLIDDEDAVLTKEGMLVELIEDNEKLIKILKMVFKASEEAVEPGFNDFIAGRIDAHKKHGWMLKASAKGSI